MFKKLRIKNVTQKTSETGAVSIHATISTPEPIFIYDDVKAVIDGSITANLLLHGKIVGQAILVLPAYGAYEEITIQGICLMDTQTTSQYKIEFKPNNLWAIEL